MKRGYAVRRSYSQDQSGKKGEKKGLLVAETKHGSSREKGVQSGETPRG